MSRILTMLSTLIVVVFWSLPLGADQFEFNRINMSFKNFLTCELTRTGAVDHFDGRSFKITMIDLFDIQTESDLKIITGAVKCAIEGKLPRTLYAAVGIKKLMDTEQVLYYTIRGHDFSILATELMKFPYKERCGWTQYWIDLD